MKDWQAFIPGWDLYCSRKLKKDISRLEKSSIECVSLEKRLELYSELSKNYVLQRDFSSAKGDLVTANEFNKRLYLLSVSQLEDCCNFF